MAIPCGPAAKLKPHADKGLSAVVDAAYRAAFGRPPTKDEMDAGAEYLTKRGKLDKALQEYALVLFSLNEFIYVD